ncbi:LLM class flavin-dependent oxidoreductase [Chiayiivirga flava]|uniref:Luciferase-like monooxygenase n=1 Tax=Chiayiivirga flava TaxID=659595 RepID=A0A7W8G2A3_9GAMM|nr:LLM class flavin-dependent oxidoreductase [Chiayiivirga flava]MBB5208490.1 luciferase family oxidoreductase group 1 [Chiayiivirga flava]
MIPFSVLDLAPICAGGTASQSFANTRDLAQHAERWNYNRYWLAEHHNMTGIASAATAVVIGHVAGATSRIRVGAGGIMLPNHAPLVVAEQFGTLESLYPGRIDLGLGRAPGTDQRTARALRHRHDPHIDVFAQDAEELFHYFEPAAADQPVRAVPGAGLDVPIWILGSSLYGAQFAAARGLPFAFASHFAPAQLKAALQIYRDRFQPSERLAAPYAMVGINVVAADSIADAQRAFTSQQRQFLNLIRGRPGQLQPPIDGMDDVWSLSERQHIEQALACSFVGTPDGIRPALRRFIDETGADELIVAGHIFDHATRLRSYELAAQVRDSL